jgi:hypothetical protein
MQERLEEDKKKNLLTTAWINEKQGLKYSDKISSENESTKKLFAITMQLGS